MRNTSKSTWAFLFVLLAVAVFLLTYVFVFTPMFEESFVLRGDIELLETELVVLRNHEENLPQYEKEIDIARVYIKEQLSAYPVDILEEDVIVWLLGLENAFEVNIDNLSLGGKNSLLTFPAAIEVDGADVTTEIEAGTFVSSYSGNFSYDNMKNMIKYIYASEDRSSLDNITMSYDPTNAQLLVNVNISKYFVDYPGAIYEPLPMPETSIGVDDLFRTIESEEVTPEG